MNGTLRDWRKTQGLSQKQAGALLGVQQRTFSRWERGDVPINVERVPQISQITGIPRIELRPDKPDLFA